MTKFSTSQLRCIFVLFISTVSENTTTIRYFRGVRHRAGRTYNTSITLNCKLQTANKTKNISCEIKNNPQNLYLHVYGIIWYYEQWYLHRAFCGLCRFRAVHKSWRSSHTAHPLLITMTYHYHHHYHYDTIRHTVVTKGYCCCSYYLLPEGVGVWISPK